MPVKLSPLFGAFIGDCLWWFFKNWDTISLHKIITILKCTVQWHLVQPPPLPSLITLSSTLKKTLSPAVTPHLSLAAINVFPSPWIYLVLEVSHLWNQTMCGLLCLTFFTGCVLEVHPYCSMCQFFIPFYGWVTSRWKCKKCGFHHWVGKTPWRREWQPTPVFLPGESHGRRSLMGCGPKGFEESDMTEAT